MTLFVKVVEALLDERPTESRAAFCELANDAHCEVRDAIDIVLTVKLCQLLINDVAPMSANTCRNLAMPEGTTYARGSDAWLRGRLEKYVAEHTGIF